MNKKNHIWVVAVLVLIFLAIFCISNLSTMMGVISFLGGIVGSVLVGFSIAFVINIPMTAVERLYIKLFSARRRKLRRAVSILVCYLGLVGIMALLMGIILPQIVTTAREIVGKTSFYVETAQEWYGKLGDLLKGFSITLPPLDLSAETITAKLTELLDQHKNTIVGTSVDILSKAFSVIVDTVFALVISVYVLAQKEKLGSLGKKLLYSLFDEKTAERAMTFTRLTAKTFSSFVTGQLIEAFILGGLCFIGMLIFRMPYAALISLIMTVTALVPVFGAFIGAGIGAFLILFESPITAIGFLVYIIVLQQLEGNLIYPKVVGSQIGLPGLWVLVSVTVGSEFGIVGMLVGVPIASLLYTLIHQFVDARLEQKGLTKYFEEDEPDKKLKMKKPRKKRKRKKTKNNEAMNAESETATVESAEQTSESEISEAENTETPDEGRIINNQE